MNTTESATNEEERIEKMTNADDTTRRCISDINPTVAAATNNNESIYSYSVT